MGGPPFKIRPEKDIILNNDDRAIQLPTQNLLATQKGNLAKYVFF